MTARFDSAMETRARILLSLVVIAVATGATMLALELRPPPPPPPADSNEPLFDFDPATVRSIDVTAWQGGLAAERGAAGWEVAKVSLRRPTEAAPPEGAEPPPTPSAGEVDRVVEALVREVVGLPVIDRFPREDRPLSDFGLAEPQAVIALGLADGSTRRLEIGSLTLTSTALYARAAPPDDVIEVGSIVFSAIDAALYRLRSLAAG
jgi:Domain of unknown function (DUF4340)